MRLKIGNVFLLAAAIIFLAGCRVEMATELEKTPPKPTGKMVKFDGTVKLQGNELIVEGHSNLPEDAIMFAGIKEYGDFESYARVIRFQGEEDEEYTTESTGKVDKEGKFEIKVDRVNPEKRYKLEVLFNPAIQKSKIQEIYGMTGENIAKNIGYLEFEHNGNTVAGMIKVAPIVNINDPSGDGIKWNLTDVFQGKSRPVK